MTHVASPHLDVAGIPIAYRHRTGREPGVMWLGGYRSDMLGTKAEALDAWAAAQGRSFTRHDYSGHGESGGAFRDGTLSRWIGESLAVFRTLARGPQVLVGSSMGAWIALRMTKALAETNDPRTVVGLVLIAPAADFTSELVEPRLTAAQKRSLATKGYFEKASDYPGQPYMYTRELIEDGRRNKVLDAPIDTHCPVHIVQGLRDADVPYEHALRLASCLPSDDVTVSMVPDGDHRLSRPEDIALIIKALEAVIERAG